MIKLTKEVLKNIINNINDLQNRTRAKQRRGAKSKTSDYHVKPFYQEWLDLEPVLKHIHSLGLEQQENEALLLKIYDTLHMEILDETLHHIPQDKHQEFLQHVKEENDPSRLFTHYGVSHNDIKPAIIKKGEQAISTMQLALEKSVQ